MVSLLKNSAVAIRMIDSNSSLEIPLFENVYLSGIKMIDGWLHIQLHYVDHHMLSDEEGMYRPYQIWVTGEDTYKDDKFHLDHYVLTWGGNPPYWGDELQEWEEYVYPVDEELLEKAGSIPVTISENLGAVNADCKVQIPLRLVRDAN